MWKAYGDPDKLIEKAQRTGRAVPVYHLGRGPAKMIIWYGATVEEGRPWVSSLGDGDNTIFDDFYSRTAESAMNNAFGTSRSLLEHLLAILREARDTPLLWTEHGDPEKLKYQAWRSGRMVPVYSICDVLDGQAELTIWVESVNVECFQWSFTIGQATAENAGMTDNSTFDSPDEAKEAAFNVAIGCFKAVQRDLEKKYREYINRREP
jgi:hypothetical protein